MSHNNIIGTFAIIKIKRFIIIIFYPIENNTINKNNNTTIKLTFNFVSKRASDFI